MSSPTLPTTVIVGLQRPGQVVAKAPQKPRAADAACQRCDPHEGHFPNPGTVVPRGTGTPAVG